MKTHALARRTLPTARPQRAAAWPAPVNATHAAIRHALGGPAVQAKFTVGPPNDAYEQEADRVADQVMRMPEPGGASVGSSPAEPPRIQRVCKECEEETKVQRLCSHCEEGLQRKETSTEVPAVDSALEARIRALQGAGQPLPTSTRAFFEPRFGQDFGGVRVHTGGAASEVAGALRAKAFTTGETIVFGRGQYEPGAGEGRRLLAHELTHVVQQAEPTVRPARSQESASAALDVSADAAFLSAHTRVSLPLATRPQIQRQLPTSGAERMSLQELWSAVEATSVGKKFLTQLAETKRKIPSPKWGQSDFRGKWDGKNIILNKAERDQRSDNEWKQVIAMELGNAVNDAKFQQIRTSAEKDPPSREEYIAAFEKVEFDTRLEVIAAYSAGEFCQPIATEQCPAAFDVTVTDFQAYTTDPRGQGHREYYGAEWDLVHKKKYMKTHAPGKN